MREPLRSCGPVVRTEIAELARIVDIDGRGRRGIVRFEHEVHWVREVSPRVVFRHEGVHLKDGTRFCDVGRYMGSLADAIDVARDACERYRVVTASSLEIAVLVAVTEIPVLPVDEDAPVPGRARIHGRVPEDWLRDCDRVEACLLARNGNGDWPEGGLPRLVPLDVAVECIWSSQSDAAANSVAIDRFRTAWMHR